MKMQLMQNQTPGQRIIRALALSAIAGAVASSLMPRPTPVRHNNPPFHHNEPAAR